MDAIKDLINHGIINLQKIKVLSFTPMQLCVSNRSDFYITLIAKC